jgi:hypothetical protein
MPLGSTRLCSPHGEDLIKSTRLLNVVNGVAWGAAIAGVAVGLPLVIVGGKAAAPRATGQAGADPRLPVAITAGALPGGGGVWMTRSF